MSIHKGFGTCYWGRDYRTGKSQLHELKLNGFSWIVFPVSEERILFDLHGVKELIEVAKDLGFETWVSPWGVSGVFGGEGVASRDLDGVGRWVDRALVLNTHGIYWDEPKGVHGPTIPHQFHSAFEHHALYFNPDLAVLPAPRFLEGIRAIGVDAYGKDPGEAQISSAQLASAYGASAHVWVQGFRIQAGMEWQVEAKIRGLHVHGVESIGIWGGGRSGDGVSCLRNDNEDMVFLHVQQALKWCREK